MTTYDVTRDAINDVLEARDQARKKSGFGLRGGDEGGKWPAWGQLAIAVLAMIVTVVMAYAALDKRISLIEQKLDYVVQQVRAR